MNNADLLRRTAAVTHHMAHATYTSTRISASTLEAIGHLLTAIADDLDACETAARFAADRNQ